MKAFIYVGGKIDVNYITEHPKGEDITVAADSGIRNALALGDRVDVAVGDFDSFPESEIPEGAEVIRLKPEKDITDAQAAIEIAIERGADSFVIIGGLSGRLDHTLSNLAILERLYAMNVHAVITDGRNRARFVRNGSTLIGRSAFRYLSLIAADPVVKGVEIDGVKYPLKKATLRREQQYAVSNELTGNCAFIAVKKGGLWVIESVE